MDVVRKAVQQHDRGASRIAQLMKSDVKHTGAYPVQWAQSRVGHDTLCGFTRQAGETDGMFSGAVVEIFMIDRIDRLWPRALAYHAL